MADTILPVQLNKGLDLVTPPLLAAEGAIIDCLNYEMTDVAGYRRIDGYERYDGYPNGDINNYYSTTITATNPLEQPLIVPGSIIQRTGNGMTLDIGAVVGTSTTANTYDFVSFNSIDNFLVQDTNKFLLEGGGNILLEAGGYLLLNGESDALDAVQVVTPSGTTVAVTLSGTVIDGRETASASTFLSKVRSYSSVLRSLVQRAPSTIAGLQWFEDRLLVAVDCTSVYISVLAANPQPLVGVRLRWDGVIYRLIYLDLVTEGTTNQYLAYMFPIGTSVTVDDDLVEVNTAGTAGTVWVTAVTSNGNPATRNTAVASIGYYNRPSMAAARGFTFLPSGTSFAFDTGTYTGTLPTPAVTLDDSNPPSDAYYVVGDAGASVMRVRLTKVVQDGGNFATGTATGSAQVVVLDVIAGTRDHVKDNDVIHSRYPTDGTSATLTVNGTPTMSTVAGTKALRAAGTRYVWDTYNFYGQSATLSAYGTTGASQAFWANEHGFGNIATGVPVGADIPKYVSFHAGKLALAFARGSVVLSVIGEPYNFNGLDGAIEVATGDDITGLLELPGDTMAVFGKRAIRKITGFTDADTVLGTIAGGSSCFDYTAVLIGQEAVYCGVHGITTLQQSASYGDFVGQRLSDPISTWLRPKLVSSVEGGGVAMAYPVRSKSQYRLVLNTGDVVVATLTADGAKLTFMNHGLTNQVRIPFAWSSTIDEDGQERLHVRWDAANYEDIAIALDKGWGFDGYYFNHRFDLAHFFNKHGSEYMGVEKARLYGQGYGVATLNIKSSGIETDFDQDYHDALQDISMPPTPYKIYDRMKPVTSIVDQANWGIGIKLRIGNTTSEGSTVTEPPHMCQVLVLHMRMTGAGDN